MVLGTVLFLLLAFLAGSMPFGKLIARWVARIDITSRGSGNIGATNVARELGLKWGIITLVLDVLKGWGPVFAYKQLFPGQGAAGEFALAAVCVAALLGHQFSFMERFHGGKGVATALGAFLAISPLSCLLALIVFVGVVKMWDYISLGSLVGTLSMPVFLGVLGKGPGLVTGSVVMGILIWMKHRDNIARLAAGTERKWRSRQPQERTSRRRSSSPSEK